MAELQKTSFEMCSNCKYYYDYAPSVKPSNTQPKQAMCGYYAITGKRRGCKVGECNKFEKQIGARNTHDDECWVSRKRLVKGW